MRKRVALAMVLAGAGCVPAPLVAKETVDLIVHDGQVLTVDPAFSVRSAVAVRGGRIVATGGEDLLDRYGATTVIDLHGKTLLPGFIDAHLHPIPIGPSDVNPLVAHSIVEIQDMVRKKAAELGPGKWITGYGWQEAALAEKRNLTRADLDAAAPDNPVLLVRAGAHSAAANSLALKLAGVTRDTPDPKGGLIEHLPDGEPGGIIRERQDIVERFIPPPTWAEMKAPMIRTLQGFLALGITSFHDASGKIDDEPVGLGGIAPAEPGGEVASGEMTFHRAQALYAEMGDRLPRVTMYISYPGAARLAAFPHHTGYGDDRVRLGAIGENLVDGGFTGPTAWLLADYKGQPGFRGKGRYTDAELQDMVDTANRLGWQMGLHCIGDAAIVQTIKAYARSLESIPDPAHAPDDRRWMRPWRQWRATISGSRSSPIFSTIWKIVMSRCSTTGGWSTTIRLPRPRTNSVFSSRSAATICRSGRWSGSMPRSPAKVRAAWSMAPKKPSAAPRRSGCTPPTAPICRARSMTKARSSRASWPT
jgi:predicted amidohydrolase YtcJ